MTDTLIQLPNYVQDYLKKFGMNNWRAETSHDGSYTNIVVVPAIQEYENLKALLRSLSLIDKKYFTSTLLLFVINNTISSSEEVKKENQETLSYFRSLINHKYSDSLSQEIIDSGINIGIVDSCSPNLQMPDKEGGVGFARKIGMDLALTLFDYASTQKKIIICLDADCKVEPNYLTTIVEEVNSRKINAGYVEYEHLLTNNEEEQRAIICYEIFLRYYVLGLRFASSLFAFDSIGSTMFCDADYYIKIGGMNKRKAAEDFYFLEKLAKITGIIKINSTRIHPSPRRSWRVPFGTGQRMNRFFAGTHDEYSLINPQCFDVLKQWLALFSTDSILSGEEYLEHAEKIHKALVKFLAEQKFVEAWNKIIADSKKENQINKQKQIWFDGFRTMKLIHFLRDNAFPNINMFEALDELLSHFDVHLDRTEPIPDLSIQLQYLNAIRNID